MGAGTLYWCVCVCIGNPFPCCIFCISFGQVFKLQGGEKNVSIAPGLETHVAVRFQCGKDKSAASKDDSSGARKAHTGYLEVQSGSDIYKVKILA